MDIGYDLPASSRWREPLSERIHLIKDINLDRDFLAIIIIYLSGWKENKQIGGENRNGILLSIKQRRFENGNSH